LKAWTAVLRTPGQVVFLAFSAPTGKVVGEEEGGGRRREETAQDRF
jgi:hypothetical protein